MMGWYHGGAGWGGWILMTVAMVAFWALVILAIVAIFRDTHAPASTIGRRDPMQILDERFARGEIGEDEYHDRSSVLRAAAP